MGHWRTEVLAASRDRDRVVDSVKAAALVLVVIGHNLAWTSLPDGQVITTLDAAPFTYPLTWILEIIPLFFFMAGWGIRTLPQRPVATLYSRGARLLGPALPLIAVAVLLALTVAVVSGPDLAAVAGVLTVQPLWFLGAYLLVLACSGVITRVRKTWHFAVWIAVIGCVDALRVFVAEPIGWANLLLVWALFAALGVHRDRLRSAPMWMPALGLVVCVAGAITLIARGPYSAALITTNALPGITNLAPPTLVMACAGMAQICVLLLVWRGLEWLLAHDRLWVVMALVASRSMELYLWHVLLMSLMVAAVLAVGLAPAALSATWWILHLVILIIDAGVILLAAPYLRRISLSVVRLLSRGSNGRAFAQKPRHWAIVILVSMSLATLLISEGGVHAPFMARTVIIVPFIPILALVVVTAGVALCARAASNPPPVTRLDSHAPS